MLDTNMSFVRPKRQENTEPCTNYAVKYAIARGHLVCRGNFKTVP